MIGPLQTNKVKEAVALFDVIQTLDRARLADALATERNGTRPAVARACSCKSIPGRSRKRPARCRAKRATLIDHARKLELPLEGLICIPPVYYDAAPHFAFLAKRGARSRPL